MAVLRCLQPVCFEVTLSLDVAGSQQVQQDLGSWPGRTSTNYGRCPYWYVLFYSRVSQTCNKANAVQAHGKLAAVQLSPSTHAQT